LTLTLTFTLPYPYRRAQEGSTLKLHAHLPCLHAELGKRCIATCPASWAQGGSTLDCGGARLVVGHLIVQPSYLAEQHVLLRLDDWSQGHPTDLGSGNISLEDAVDVPAHPTSYEVPFARRLRTCMCMCMYTYLHVRVHARIFTACSDLVRGALRLPPVPVHVRVRVHV